MPIPWLQMRFKQLNPEADPLLIDWESTYDSLLTDRENLPIFAEAYPLYQWFTTSEEQREARVTLQQKLKEDIDFLTFTIGTFPDDVRKDLEPIIEELGRRALESVTLQRTVSRLRAQLRGKKPEEWRRRFFEIVPVGVPREVPVERIPPRPERRVAVEVRAERLVEEIGRRIVEAPDYYSALGLPVNAKTEDIMDTLRLFLSTYHPDVYPKPEAASITRRLVEIRETLTDPRKRRVYDQRILVPVAPTVQVAVGRPVVYCTECQKRGRLVMMEYNKTYGPYESTGRSYDIYKCPDPTCPKERVANFYRGVFIGFGK